MFVPFYVVQVPVILVEVPVLHRQAPGMGTQCRTVPVRREGGEAGLGVRHAGVGAPPAQSVKWKEGVAEVHNLQFKKKGA